MSVTANQNWFLFPFGALGSMLPNISSITHKTEYFTFNISLESAIATMIYITSAAVIAAIFPYGRKDRATPFNAVLVGILFPTIVGGALTIAKGVLPIDLPDPIRGVEGVGTLGRWVEAFALF